MVDVCMYQAYNYGHVANVHKNLILNLDKLMQRCINYDKYGD